MFKAEAQLGALKILKICRTKNVSNEYPHLLRLQVWSIFTFEISPYKNDSALCEYWLFGTGVLRGRKTTNNIDDL
jgi:hypothetical protein